jgi:hypothetical protein
MGGKPMATAMRARAQIDPSGRDFEGGELVLTEQRPRTRSRVEVVPLQQGEAVMFAVNFRPARRPRPLPPGHAPRRQPPPPWRPLHARHHLPRRCLSAVFLAWSGTIELEHRLSAPTDRDIFGCMSSLRAFWFGDLPLGEAFWTYAVGGGIAVNVITSLLFLALISWDRPLVAVLIGYGLSVPYNGLAVVGVWRSAARYPGERLHADLARIATLVGMVLLSVT